MRSARSLPRDPAFVGDAGDEALFEPLRVAYYHEPDLAERARGERAQTLRVLSWAGSIDPERRRETMNATNPRYVLRNYMAQPEIDDAEKRRLCDVELQFLTFTHGSVRRTTCAWRVTGVAPNP